MVIRALTDWQSHGGRLVPAPPPPSVTPSHALTDETGEETLAAYTGGNRNVGIRSLWLHRAGTARPFPSFITRACVG